MSYYEDIDNPLADPWVRVGWRQRIEQAYRFEAALEVVQAAEGLVLDVGCGLGALFDYAQGCGVARDWVGVEAHAPFAREAAKRHAVITARFEDTLPPAGVSCAVAIGTLAGTHSRLEQIVEFLSHAPVFCLIVLDREAVSARAAFAEHRATAVRLADLDRLARRLGPCAEATRISPTDLVLVRWPGVDYATRDVRSRFAATIDGPWGSVEEPERKAWLACELGLVDEALLWLDRATEQTEFATLIRARLEHGSSAV